jgi:arginyl-tRNA synthetase
VVNLEESLNLRLSEAFGAVAGEPADPVLRRSQRADFQANGALALAKKLGRNPRDVAEEILRHARLDDLCSAAEVAGPGFINLTVSEEAMGRMLAEAAGDSRLGVGRTERPDRVVVDYSAPNAAKEMHVGHLRSTIIGDAAVRLLGWRGDEVLRENHIGDWGTPFGMLVEHLLDIGSAEAAHELSIGDLGAFYQAARKKFNADEAFRERARRRVVLLQSGDEETLRLWQLLVEQSKQYFMAVYQRLGVRLTEDDFAGESFYNDQLQDVVDELDKLGLLRLSDGAKCVFPAGFANRDGDPLPIIVQKSDGGFGYGATDLATIRNRIRDLHATRIVYVIGLPQSQHLQMVFETAREAGWLRPPVRAEHVGFGSVLGENGKMLASRSGASIKLADLLDEAVSRAAALVAEKDPDLSEAERAEVSQAVGIGAVKYSDLSTDRTKDYVFSWDRMLSFDGNTAPYLQYAHARIRSIFRRAGTGAPSPPDAGLVVREPAERALALEVLEFATVLEEVERTLEFHRLCGYLYELSSAFTRFYENCPVLRSEGPVRDSRLVLCDLTSRTLATGLGLLGIDAPDRM